MRHQESHVNRAGPSAGCNTGIVQALIQNVCFRFKQPGTLDNLPPASLSAAVQCMYSASTAVSCHSACGASALSRAPSPPSHQHMHLQTLAPQSQCFTMTILWLTEGVTPRPRQSCKSCLPLIQIWQSSLVYPVNLPTSSTMPLGLPDNGIPQWQ